jgi:outer membrane protein assembly factor BamD (BamD/ComL family)
MRTRGIFGALVLSLTMLTVQADVRAGEVATPLQRAKKLSASKSKTERIKALRWLKLLAVPGTSSGDEATYRYAELCLRFHAQGERAALGEAKQAFANLGSKAGSRWGLRGKIGLWRVLALEGKRAEAVKNLDRFLGRQTKCERAVEAGYFLGCIYARKRDDRAELRNAQRAFSYALALYKSVGKYRPPVISAKEIAARLAGVKRRLWELAAGKLKVLFEKAEKLRKGKKYDAAIKTYRQIRREFPGHDLTELSGLRISQCYFSKKQLKRAVIEAREFVARDPLGAYRGHAHLLIGDIHLEHFFDVAGCESEFRRILDPTKSKSQPHWINPERRKLIAYRKLDPKKTPPAKTPHKTWKGVLHSAHERVGILEYLRRDYKKAAAHFTTSAKLKPDHSYGKHQGQGMADLVDRMRLKREIIPANMLAQRAERPKLVLLLASLYMCGWRDDRALGLLRRVAGGEFKEASLNQKAYAHVKIAEGLFYKRKDKEAIKVLKLFLKKPYNRTLFTARALLQLSVVTNRHGDWKESLTYLVQCHARFPNTRWGKDSLYQHAFALYVKDHLHEALRLFKDYVAKYPNSFPVKQGHAAEFIRRINKDLAEEKKLGLKDRKR